MGRLVLVVLAALTFVTLACKSGVKDVSEYQPPNDGGHHVIIIIQDGE